MNCDEARKHWDVYHDSEGDAELCLHVNEHLGECPGCAQWFYRQSYLEDAIGAKLKGGVPDGDLWTRLESSLLEPATPVRSWLFLGVAGTVVATACGLLALAVWWGAFAVESPVAEGAVADVSVALHEGLAEGRQGVEFASRSDREIERYLRRRVAFPVRCPPRRDSGFEVHGAGVCRLGGVRSAYVVGAVGDQPVSLFILDASSLDDVARREVRGGRWDGRPQRGCATVAAEIDRNVVLAVGQTDPRRLRRVLLAYGSYPHEPAPGQNGL